MFSSSIGEKEDGKLRINRERERPVDKTTGLDLGKLSVTLELGVL